MHHRRTKGFKDKFKNLPGPVKVLAKKQFSLLKSNPSHPSLRLKELVHGSNWYSVRVSDSWRALGIYKKSIDTIVWYDLISHESYNKSAKPSSFVH